MLTLPNYQIGSQIYESVNSLVYRGLRSKDNKPVILKVLKQDYPTPAELTRYRQEYEIMHDLDLAGVIKAYGIEKYQNTLIIILEDFGGESLKQIMANEPLTVKKFLSLAIQIADSLGNIHAANIIHKDINPSNIVVNFETKLLKIIDFGIASRLPRENPTLKNPEQLEGTLAYLSPEQTGRINRSMDYRTDLYSLGVTFYELLIGQLPFMATDAMELVHCHLAKTPSPVCDVNPEIPPIVSDIVMKLLAKNAEDRYQSAFGVKTDLEKIQKNLTGLEDLSGLQFELAQNDFSGKFEIPQKLYGRDSEVNTLLQAFERVSQGSAEMMLVAGYSGVGKTALVRSVHKPMTEKRGYFAAGKFDQFQKNIPYSAISQAFNEFCRYLLMENTEVLANWKAKILAALGNNGQIIIDVIPDLELIIGPQPAVAEVGPTEAQNRFQIFSLNFIKALCDKDHPFILFIDDLQWVDSGSLALLKNIMLDDEIRHLLIIGAYRDNEVDGSHPFIMAASELQRANVNSIELANLQQEDVNHLLQDSLKCETTQPLTDLIVQKTQGNAFFTHQFLQNLYENKLLQFNFNQHQWRWDVEQIAGQNITANVVELMANKIDKLPSSTSAVLQLAACIGNQFNLSILAIIYEQDKNETLEVLRPALAEGLIQPLDENYKHIENFEKSQFKFLHDRVQQASYSLISAGEYGPIHLKIGRLLLEHIPAEELEERIFDVVNQLNKGQALITDVAENIKLAQLNWQAGKKAKAATAYEAATQYLHVGIERLPESSWQNQYELTFELYKQCAECEYLLTHVEPSEKLFRIVIDNAQTDLEKAEIYAMQMRHSIAFSKLEEAIEMGRKGLRLCGINFPADEQMLAAIQTESEQLAKLMADKPISTLIDAPQMTAEAKMVAMRILPNLTIISYLLGNNNSFTLSTLMSVNLSLVHGQLDLSAYTYTWYGVWLSTQGRLKESYEFGKLALELSARYPNCREKSQTHNLVGTFLTHINQHLKQTIPVLMKGYHTGFEVGDVLPAVFSFCNVNIQMLAAGETLPKVLAKVEKAINVAYKNKVFASGDIASGYLQLVQFLMTGDTQYALTDDTFDQEQLQRIKSSNTIAFVRHVRLCKAFWFGNYSSALEMAKKAEPTLAFIPGYITMFEHYFLYPLVLTALYADASEQEKEEYLQKIEWCEQKMKIWAESCPENFWHRYLLIQAEKSRITGNEMDAMRLYDQAIKLAKEGEFVQNAALGNELAARFWLDNGKEDFASIYMREAHYRYGQWGALAKVADLEAKYPQFLAPKTTTAIPTNATISVTRMAKASTTGSSQWLDLNSVMKAAQTLSGEIVLSRLLEKMMHIVIENAGAEKGFLLLPKQDSWFIEAQRLMDINEVNMLQSLSIENQPIAETIIHYVIRTQENVVLNNASVEGQFTHDAYIVKHRPKSVLCAPLLNQGKLTGILYLENNLTTGAFTPARLEVLNLLSSQIAISIENSLLYNNLEQKVAERTQELSAALFNLKTTQSKLVESEKMASLGGLVAGVAHEINTPIGIGVTAASTLADRTTETATAYENKQLKGSALKAYFNMAQTSSNLVLNNLNRAAELIQSFKQVAVDQSNLDKRSFAVKKYIKDTLLNLKPHLKQTPHQITVSGDEQIEINSYPGAFSQIITNLVMNSVRHAYPTFDAGNLRFEIELDSGRLMVEYSDDGCGISPENMEKIFEPFFTTARAQGGTGLGLHIVFNLVTQKLQGTIDVQSEVGVGITFILNLPLNTEV